MERSPLTWIFTGQSSKKKNKPQQFCSPLPTSSTNIIMTPQTNLDRFWLKCHFNWTLVWKPTESVSNHTHQSTLINWKHLFHLDTNNYITCYPFLFVSRRTSLSLNKLIVVKQHSIKGFYWIHQFLYKIVEMLCWSLHWQLSELIDTFRFFHFFNVSFVLDSEIWSFDQNRNK